MGLSNGIKRALVTESDWVISLTRDMSHYELLGVPRNVDSLTLRKAFRNLSKALHPDTTSLPAEEASRKFQQICEAYDLLADPSLRKSYDVKLAQLDAKTKLQSQDSLNMDKSFIREPKIIEVRRPLSGGELFSLLMLGASLLLSLLLGLVFAFSQGRELQVLPSWIPVDQVMENIVELDNAL